MRGRINTSSDTFGFNAQTEEFVDMRKLPAAAQEERRRQVIGL